MNWQSRGVKCSEVCFTSNRGRQHEYRWRAGWRIEDRRANRRHQLPNVSTSQNGLAIALELLSTHTPGAPVVDNKGKYVCLSTSLTSLMS
jgi:hypothetical protein